MTHMSLEGRAADAVKKAIYETYSAEGLDAIERVLRHMMANPGFEVDDQLRAAQTVLDCQRRTIAKKDL